MKPALVSMLDIAQAFSKLNIALTTDEQAEADRYIASIFNQAAQKAGWDARLVVFGTPPVGGLHVHVGDPATIKLKRGEWLSDTFAFLWSIGEAGCPHPAIFQDAALKRWERTLRQRVFWQQFVGDLNQKEHLQRLADNQPPKGRAFSRWELPKLIEREPWYQKPYRPSFWNVRNYSRPIRLRLKSGTSIPAWGQHGGHVYPTCVSPYGEVYYLARWAQLKPPAEQHCLKHIGRLYRQNVWSRYKRHLAQREHFSVWTDKSAQRADGRKVKERPKNRPLTVVERLKEWQRGDDDVRRRDQSAEERARAQENTIAAFVHDWQRRFPEKMPDRASRDLTSMAKDISDGHNVVDDRHVSRNGACDDRRRVRGGG